MCVYVQYTSTNTHRHVHAFKHTHTHTLLAVTDLKLSEAFSNMLEGFTSRWPCWRKCWSIKCNFNLTWLCVNKHCWSEWYQLNVQLLFLSLSFFCRDYIYLRTCPRQSVVWVGGSYQEQTPWLQPVDLPPPATNTWTFRAHRQNNPWEQPTPGTQLLCLHHFQENHQLWLFVITQLIMINLY